MHYGQIMTLNLAGTTDINIFYMFQTFYIWWRILICMTFWTNTQLPHSYYFTTRNLVLKFVNKGDFLRKSWIRIFLEKGGILVLTFLNLE